MKKAAITILKILIFFVGWAVLSGLIDIPVDNPVVWRFFAELIPLVVIVIFTVIFLRLEKGEVKIPFAENAGKGTIVGIVTGFVWIGVSTAILLILHQLAIVGKNDINIIWLWIISAFINVIMQELLVRGYLYQLLKAKYNLPLAIIITTALFTFMHGGAFEAGFIPVINVITMCLFTTALYEANGTILAPIMAHAVWNIIGAIILGGVSLADDYPSVFSMTAIGSTVLSGGDCKIEGSVIVTIINIALLLLFYIVYSRNAKIKKVS
ncbi:MAG TPA: type II CAAX endopeptidase family protein [Clostridia bacterium]|nr:type II CAAX endopeptidase family protein [Clostridia bacterium]